MRIDLLFELTILGVHRTLLDLCTLPLQRWLQKWQAACWYLGMFIKEGQKIQEHIEQTIKDKEGKTFICTSTGKNELGEVVAVFNITWSVKSK